MKVTTYVVKPVRVDGRDLFELWKGEDVYGFVPDMRLFVSPSRVLTKSLFAGLTTSARGSIFSVIAEDQLSERSTEIRIIIQA